MYPVCRRAADQSTDHPHRMIRRFRRRRRIVDTQGNSTMKAIRAQNTGGPEVLELAEVPVPQLKPAEALVKVSVAGVNSIDGQFRDGRLRMPLPFIPGQEGAGVVAEVGPQVKTLKVGDRVAWSGTPKSYAEYIAAPEEHLVPIPSSVSDQQAAASMIYGLTAHYLVTDTYKLRRARRRWCTRPRVALDCSWCSGCTPLERG